MLDTIFNTTTGETTITLTNLVLATGVALAIGLLVSIVYMKTHKNGTPAQSFMLTLVVLPVIVTVIIMLIGDSVARAFSLAGAFQIIRFRSAPGDPKDITYVLFSMAIGLSCGMGYLAYGAIVAIMLCFVMIVLSILSFGQPKQSRRLLKITVPENLDFHGIFEEILSKYTASYQRTRVRTADLGSLYEVQYTITVKDDLNEKLMIDELRCRNGNLDITMVLAPQPADEF